MRRRTYGGWDGRLVWYYTRLGDGLNTIATVAWLSQKDKENHRKALDYLKNLGDYFRKIYFDDKEVEEFRTFAHDMAHFLRANFHESFHQMPNFTNLLIWETVWRCSDRSESFLSKVLRSLVRN